jgi:hypothetical protein
MSWVEARPDLEWRWIQWIQVIIFAVFLPFIMMIPETREGVILRRKAAKKRKESRKMAEQGENDERVYLARSEINKPPLIELIKISSLRPICMSLFYITRGSALTHVSFLQGCYSPSLSFSSSVSGLQ